MWWPWVEGVCACIRGGDRYMYGGIGDGEVHRDPGVVVGDLVGVVGGVSRSDGRCAGSAQSSGARGLWSGVSMKRVAGVLVVVVEGVRGVLEMVGGVQLRAKKAVVKHRILIHLTSI